MIDHAVWQRREQMIMRLRQILLSDNTPAKRERALKLHRSLAQVLSWAEAPLEK